MEGQWHMISGNLCFCSIFLFTFTKFHIIESIFELFSLQEDLFYYSDQFPQKMIGMGI